MALLLNMLKIDIIYILQNQNSWVEESLLQYTLRITCQEILINVLIFWAAKWDASYLGNILILVIVPLTEASVTGSIGQQEINKPVKETVLV